MNILERKFPYKYFQATLWLIIANVVIYFLGSNFFYFSDSVLSLSPDKVINEGKWYQLITHFFAHDHDNHLHLLINMLYLFMFGYPVEQKIGSWEFLSVYFFTGITAGLFSLAVFWFSGQSMIHLLGASGAIFGVMLMFAAYFPDQRVYIWLLLIPLRATTVILISTALELFNNFFGGKTGVAHLTHLAGYLFAGMYLGLRLNRNILSILMGKRYYDDYY